MQIEKQRHHKSLYRDSFFKNPQSKANKVQVKKSSNWIYILRTFLQAANILYKMEKIKIKMLNSFIKMQLISWFC
jgi:hypothetical protein